MGEKIIQSIGLTDKGLVKTVNQDSILIKEGKIGNEEAYLFVVCDGVGGLSKGEIASKRCIEVFEDWFKETIKKNNIEEKEIKETLKKNVLEGNRKIIQYGLNNGYKLGTTLSALFIYKGEYYIVHVGDSKIYKMKKYLNKLTEDHSYIGMKIRNGEMTEEEAKNSKQKNLLLQCVGVKEEIEIFEWKGKTGNDEFFILGSDGIYNKLSIREIEGILKRWKKVKEISLKELAYRMIELVKERNERDNISLIIVYLNIEKKSFFSRVFN